MIPGGRRSPMKRWGYLHRKRDEYMLMLRVDDWKLARKTDIFRSMVQDIYAFPPFQHISLYGPFLIMPGETPAGVYNAVESAAAGIPGISFCLSGYLRLTGRRGQAVTHRVIPSDNLTRFHGRLWQNLGKVAGSMSWIDRTPVTRHFHISHAYNLRSPDADRICAAVKKCQENTMDIRKDIIKGADTGKEGFGIPVHAGKPVILPDYGSLTSLRVIVLKNGIIDREFDLPAREWLNRELVFNRNRTAVSVMQYRKLAGLEIVSLNRPPDKPPFIISDLHLGHNNIIRYCRRPFSNAGEMDRVLISNWNRTVGEHDEILYLGDFRYGPETPPSSEYRHHMNGRITFIRGNHDMDIEDALPSLQVVFNGEKFLFIHNPDDAPEGFDGWVVHGHYHNNNLEKYPYINIGDRRVNVSCELTGYRPVSLD
ncbi:hypothetical protein EHM76_06110, partial [bacterium]